MMRVHETVCHLFFICSCEAAILPLSLSSMKQKYLESWNNHFSHPAVHPSLNSSSGINRSQIDEEIILLGIAVREGERFQWRGVTNGISNL